jgi:maleylpyruvate isomerase
VDSAEDQRNAAVAGARAAHRRLIEDIANLTDEQARSASLLPDWTIGHVLAHIARNGDSFTRMMSAALEGEVVSQYDGGQERRSADIEAGAVRPASELVADVTDSATRLEAVWDSMTPQAWAGHGVNAAGATWSCEAMPFHRWREVIVHHVDAGLGFTAGYWPSDYVERELAISLRLLPERLDAGGQRAMLAWLLGRGEQPSLSLAPWQFRAEHYLR